MTLTGKPLLFMRALARVAFPARCVTCTRALSLKEEILCRMCLRKLSVLQPPVCKTCGRPLPPFGPRRSRCHMCTGRVRPLSHVKAVVPFDATHRRLLHEVKFRKRRWILNVYKALIGKALEDISLVKHDFVVCVPIDRKRGREREFNQSEDLARMVAKGLHLPLAGGALKRKSGRGPQSMVKRRKDRLKNLRGQFYVKSSRMIKNRSILLVDDIYTSGATLNECAHVLRQAGARDVTAFVLARAV